MPLHAIGNSFRNFFLGLFTGAIPSPDNDLRDGSVSMNILKDGSGNTLTD